MTDASDNSAGRALFATRWGVVLTTAGAAIGLGNIWRFPYMMGESGGAAFLLIYLGFVAVFGIPGIMAECALGRATRRGPVGALRAASLPGARFFSGVIVVTVVMAAAYYGVVLAEVLGWAVSFSVATVSPGWTQGFDGLVSRFTLLVVMLAMAGGALGLGLRRGVERLSTFGLPLFFLLFVGLIVWVLRLEGAVEGLRGFLVPHLGDVTPGNALAAMGQAFFSLGVSGSFLVTYGSHMRESESIPRVAVGTAVADVGAALLAGMFVVPAVFALGKTMSSGPGLIFDVLPDVFEGMPAGNVVGAIFFWAVFLVGLLSMMAALEVPIGAAIDTLRLPRPGVVAMVCGITLLLSIPAVLSGAYVGWSDRIWGGTMMPVSSVIAVVTLAWFLGRARALEEIGRGSSLPVNRFLLFWIKYVLPVGIVTMLVYGWVSAG